MKQNSLENGVFQFALWIVVLVLIITRIVYYAVDANNWIWLVNYIGMGIALVNLLLNKCVELRHEKSKKYKPFKGLLICVVAFLCICAIPIQKVQTSGIGVCLNDVITLLALFFSLPQGTWNYFLNLIVEKIKM